MATVGMPAGGGALRGFGARLRAWGRRYLAPRRRRTWLARALAYWAVSWLFTVVVVVWPGLLGIGGASGTTVAPFLVQAAERDGVRGVVAKLLYLAMGAAVVGPVMLPLGLLSWVLTSPLAVPLVVLLMALLAVGASVVLVRVVAALNGGQVPGVFLHLWLIDMMATRVWYALRPTPAEHRRLDREDPAGVRGRLGEPERAHGPQSEPGPKRERA